MASVSVNLSGIVEVRCTIFRIAGRCRFTDRHRSTSQRVGGDQIAEVRPAVAGQRPLEQVGVERPECGHGPVGEAVLAAYPRVDFACGIVRAFVDGLADRPATAFGTFNTDLLERTLPGYRRPNFCDLIAANPLGG